MIKKAFWRPKLSPGQLHIEIIYEVTNQETFSVNFSELVLEMCHYKSAKHYHIDIYCLVFDRFREAASNDWNENISKFVVGRLL